ncbi:hypothetical protein ACQP1P_35500 [Dactylosporangium sp. CA-052675]|uniref:hypothetical protein n=1 Tax=Dactylosporangium sp. CA-052675 TaxID=3239927 RepID=UPI003D8F01F2
MRRFVAKILLVLGIAAAVGGGVLVPSPAHAAPTAGYPNALVEYLASTRTMPSVSDSTYWGYALSKGPGLSGRQTVAVGCWQDGDWATGNYSTNRWFKVYVWESYNGFDNPQWLFVHASYVYNQPVVPRCNGIWLPSE